MSFDLNEKSSDPPRFPSRDLARKWFGGQIPDLDMRAEGFITDLNVVDDELLALFVEEINRAVQGLIQAVSDENETGIREQAHTLQGMGGTVGAPEISVLGEELSLRAQKGDYSGCRHLVASFQGWQAEWTSPETGQEGVIESMPKLSGLILVVDDERANRRFLEKLLRDCGGEVYLAENGEEALEMIRRYRPDVALVDVMMNGIDGYEVCERVSQNPELNQTLVIMVTAKSTVKDIEHAFLKGAFDYIRKPFHSRELVARVRNALMLKRNTDALESWKARMSREMEMAGAVQSKLFNAQPFIGKRFDVFMSYRPSQHVGGDMFDLHALPDGRLLGYVADVAGHGVASSLISTLIKGLITEIIFALHEPSLFEIGNELHRRFRNCVFEPEIYATMLLFRANPDSRRIETLSCGHPAPLIVRTSGEEVPALISEHGGMPIGMMPEEMGTPYSAEDELGFTLPNDACVYVFTDGLVEARNSRREECGVEGLRSALKQVLERDPVFPDTGAVIEALENAGFDTQKDDCTLMCLSLPPASDLYAGGVIGGSLADVNQLSRELAACLEEHGWDSDTTQLIRLLVMEHGTNVIKHGSMREGETIFYRLTRHSQGAVLAFSDGGCAWAGPDQRRRSDSGEEGDVEATLYAENGRGLELLRQLSRESLSFRRDNRNHALYLLERNLSRRLNQIT
ncbi:MAG: SpoIIE family protein phosphatase [Verrucomicrobia bacterium]|nr:SpoIIE family protein phosphatase [Verrucomicrobiota bacterium]MCH8528177.1 SpoIIE family protein phosphatase [Kiritimatiellia bacterium]